MESFNKICLNQVGHCVLHMLWRSYIPARIYIHTLFFLLRTTEMLYPPLTEQEDINIQIHLATE